MNIAGMKQAKGWWDANYGVGGTNKVSLWADRSGNDIDVTQSTEASMPYLEDASMGGMPSLDLMV